MKTNAPGIFIPFFEEVNLLVYHTEKDKFIESLCQREQHLSELLASNDIDNTVAIACKLGFNISKQVLRFQLGCLLSLEHPHQLEYLKALKVLQKEFEGNSLVKTDEYSVPINSVPAAGLGQVTKTLYCKIAENSSLENYKYHLNRLSTMLQQLYKRDGFAANIILSLEEDHLALQATSPILLQANYHAWQQYLGKALKREGYSPFFCSTWSTNNELAAYYLEKSQELQKKQQQEYEEKIAARNQ